jgi:ATP:ADP antiporter, AAA family
MLGAGAMTAQLVSGKAVRDALFLSSVGFSALPAMLVASSLCSILLVAANARASRRIPLAVLVPASFAGSGVLFLVEWLLQARTPVLAAVIVYLHVSGAGALLGSGFWLIASERFDPRTARKRFGQIAGAGTLGGVISALLVERLTGLFGMGSVLPFLAVLQFLSAWLVRQVAGDTAANRSLAAQPGESRASLATSSGLRVIAEVPYLRNLAALVLAGTTGAALLDYLFKAQVLSAFTDGDQLLRFFALYYGATSVLTFTVQAAFARGILHRFGLGVVTSTPSLALFGGGVVGLLAPGLASFVIARASETVLRNSLYRAAYELVYTPIPPAEKRAAKSLIDVGFDRLGDGVGGAIVRFAALLPVSQASAILWCAMGSAVAAVVAASRLNRGYIATLQNSLIARGGDVHVTEDLNRTLMRSIRQSVPGIGAGATPDGTVIGAGLDPELSDVLALRSRDRSRVFEVLSRQDGLAAGLVPHVIPLLAWDAVADHALFALRTVAEEHVGQLVDGLIDPNQDFAVRRRLARVFSVCVSQRAADGLVAGLDDPRFDVRYQCARSLASLIEKNPRVDISDARIFDVVLREVTVGRPVWESRRLLDESASDSPLDTFVRDRAGQSLAHVFTLLSLVMHPEPLKIAFRSLQSDDEYLQGTALEYLDSVLPPAIRRRLWPFLERRPLGRSAHPREELIAQLLRSNHSVMLNLEDLRRRVPSISAGSAV